MIDQVKDILEAEMTDKAKLLILEAMVVMHEEDRYCVPLPGLYTTDGSRQYLTHKNGNWFACRYNPNLRQTWKQEHLKYIPPVYMPFIEKVTYNPWGDDDE